MRSPQAHYTAEYSIIQQDIPKNYRIAQKCPAHFVITYEIQILNSKMSQRALTMARK